MLRYANGDHFATGRARFEDRDSAASEPTAKIFVRVGLPGLEGPILAELDTGAPWSLLNQEVAEELGLFENDEDDDKTSVITASGKVTGRLKKVALSVLAEEGDSLEIEASVLVSEEWSGPSFLGYSGLLEWIRFGLDPQANQFYFGGY
jgi:hypothetical protein